MRGEAEAEAKKDTGKTSDECEANEGNEPERHGAVGAFILRDAGPYIRYINNSPLLHVAANEGHMAQPAP